MGIVRRKLGRHNIMAHMCQKRKKQLAPAIKEVLKKYNVRGTLSVEDHSALVVTIREGPIDFETQYNERQKAQLVREYGAEYPERMFFPCEGAIQVNRHFLKEWEGVAGELLKELLSAMMGDLWYDNSDPQFDHFDIAYYMHIHVGEWNKPYICNSPLAGVSA